MRAKNATLIAFEVEPPAQHAHPNNIVFDLSIENFVTFSMSELITRTKVLRVWEVQLSLHSGEKVLW